MSVVIVLEGVGPDRFTVAVSPLAELAATLHVLTERTHHAEHASWASAVISAAPPAFTAGLRRFTPRGHRCVGAPSTRDSRSGWPWTTSRS